MKNFDIQMSGHEKRYRSEEIAPEPLDETDQEEKHKDQDDQEERPDILSLV